MKINDYVRTKNGYISKYIGKNKTPSAYGKHLSFETTIRDVRFTEIDDDTMIWESELKKGLEKIIKSSPNIIELLEEHDLVVMEYFSLSYGKRVTRLFEVDYKDKNVMTLSNAHYGFMLKNNEFNDNDKGSKPIIKSIVTKEQFESMEYKVGVNNEDK